MKRRTWLGLGLGAAVALALGGGAVALWRPALVASKLSPEGRELMRAVAGTVLEGMWPAGDPERAHALDAQISRVEQTIASFPAVVQAEIQDLLTLLTTAPGRRLLVGLATPWAQASTAELGAALNDMRLSGSTLRLQAFHALRDLNHGSFYADSSSWSSIGYPGPPRVG